MLKDITGKIDRILKMPRPKRWRTEISEVLKECYMEGREDEKKKKKMK